jgi:hypothetical protein
MSDVDYSAIPIPEDKAPHEYTYNERRAEILRMMEQKGHPWGFNYSQLARRYGPEGDSMHHSTIQNDFEKLREWYKERVGNDAKETSELAYTRIIREHLNNGNLEKARRALDSWNDWLQDTGEQPTEPDELRLSGEGEDGEIMIDWDNADT